MTTNQIEQIRAEIRKIMSELDKIKAAHEQKKIPDARAAQAAREILTEMGLLVSDSDQPQPGPKAPATDAEIAKEFHNWLKFR